MIWITTYKTKPYMSREDTKEMMAVFAEAGSAPGTIAHYVAVDGSHGVVVSESDDVEANYRNLLRYTQWIEFDTASMLTVEDALPHILDELG